MTNYSRSVLLSNGYKHPENRLKKFEVSLKITSTNLAKKLPSQTLSQTVSHRDFQLLSQTAHVCFHRRKCTHSPLLKGSHTTAHTPKQGRFRWGRYYYPRTVSHVSETLRGQGGERQTLPFLGLGRVCSRRTQRAYGTAMCLCASLSRRRRGPAGLRDPFSSVEIVACMPCAQGLSACARHGRYYYPRRALHAAETPDGRLSKRLTCRFLASPM